jgi:hypothetical protein
VGGAGRRRTSSRTFLRRLSRPTVEAQRRLDDQAARPGKAQGRYPSARRQCHELLQGERRLPTLLSFDDAKTLSTNSVTLCTDFAAALKIAKPIQFKENIALVLKYFDQLVPFMQEQDSSLRPAD